MNRECENDIDKVSDHILSLLQSRKPFMVGRFGSNEIGAVTNYLAVIKHDRSILHYVFLGGGREWWWNCDIISHMQSNAGFFPSNEQTITEFSKLMLEDMRELDLLGSWREEEEDVADYMPQGLKRTKLLYLEPWWAKNPWSRGLKGKHVLVVHPFKETILMQYEKRTKLFDKEETLPEFASLKVIKAVQRIGGEDNGFTNWFEALDNMKSAMDKEDYDVALIGCGAYGFPLAAHAKRTGHQAIHLGGALQLLFGIKGRRWESEQYGHISIGPGKYAHMLSNPEWVYPLDENRPKYAGSIEGGCYWK